MLRTSMMALVLGLAGWLAAGGAMAQEPRTALMLSGEAVSPLTIDESGVSGAAPPVQLKLDFKAAVESDASAYRLIASRVFFKAQGPDGGVDTDAVAAGSRNAVAARDVALAVDPLGPVAQSAKTACAAGKGSTGGTRNVTMLVPVVWRVTTGEFAFARLAAGGLRAQEDMLADAAYYSDTKFEDAEAAVAVTVSCKAANVAVAPEPAKGKSAKVEAKTEPKTETGPGARKQADAGETSGTKLVTADAGDGAAAFRCDGGIVRETLAGPGNEVCLCPGHTARRQVGDRSYTCEKRYARNR